jgi:hypothetical protein
MQESELAHKELAQRLHKLQSENQRLQCTFNETQALHNEMRLLGHVVPSNNAKMVSYSPSRSLLLSKNEP